MTGDLTAPKVLVSGAQGTEVNALTRKDYVDSAIAAGDALQVSKTGDTMTGDLTAPKVLVSGAQGTEVNALTRKDYVDTAIAAGDALQVSKTGDTMSGNLTVPKVLLSAAQGAEANAVARRDFVESTVTASGKGVKDLTIALPAGAPTSGYIPVLFRTNSTSNSFVFIDTRSIYGSEPMNNCSFLGNVRAGGWSDSGSYAYGQFTIYEVSERAIHSIHGQSETADGFVVYVETRAFPIRVRVDIETTVTAHATDVTFGTSVFKVDGQVSGNTKTSVLANFDKGSGTYRGSNRVYDNGYNPTPEAVGALPVNGNAVTASRLQTARLIAGVPFDGTSNISISATNVGAVACNASGIVSQAVDFKACRGIYTGSSVTPLELGHGEGTPKTFYIDIHTDTSADFNYRWTYAHGASGVQFSGTGDFSDIYIRSDKRLKTNLAKIGGSLDKVRRLTGYEFDKAVSLGSDVVHREVGLLADDVQAVLPYAVRESVDEEAIKTISPSALIALLVEAIKELDERTA